MDLPFAIVATLCLTASPTQKKDGRVVIAVMDLDGTLDENLARAVPAAISETLDRLGLFKPVTRKDIETMVAFEATKQFIGCQNSAACIAELGNAIGSAYVLTGTIGLVGE